MRQAMNDQPANPSALNTRISVQLDWATLKALAKQPEDRFQTAREFSDAFTKGIEASLRIFSAASAVADDAPTQRINPNLLNAARLLSGMQQTPLPPADTPTEPRITTIPGGAHHIEANSKNARVLFVDDEERILTALRSVFRTSYHVFTATNGPEALEFIKKFKPHVVVSDQRMPDMLGVELLRQVKEVAPNAVRILLTGYSDLAAIVGSINDGEVFRFISKPWDNQDIRKIMAEAVAIALELADTAASPPIVPDPMTAGILVVDADQAVFRATKELFGAAGCPVFSTKTLDDAFSIMASQEIALVLADIQIGGTETIAAFKLLKQEHPEILTIVLTATSDSELVIELINEAQIFRFLNKPVSLKLLKQHAQAALTRYQSFKQTPLLTHQHRVESTKVDSSLSEKIIGRVRSIKGWFGPE